jgi:nitrogen fixation-related uncharacterized protein
MSILFYLLSINILTGILMVYQFFLVNGKSDAYRKRNRRG